MYFSDLQCPGKVRTVPVSALQSNEFPRRRREASELVRPTTRPARLSRPPGLQTQPIHATMAGAVARQMAAACEGAPPTASTTSLHVRQEVDWNPLAKGRMAPCLSSCRAR